MAFQAKEFISVNPGVDGLELGADDGLELHHSQNIFLQIYSRCYLEQQHSFRSQGENSPFGYIKDVLAPLKCTFPRKRYLFDLIDKLLCFTGIGNL